MSIFKCVCQCCQYRLTLGHTDYLPATPQPAEVPSQQLETGERLGDAPRVSDEDAAWDYVWEHHSNNDDSAPEHQVTFLAGCAHARAQAAAEIAELKAEIEAMKND